MRILKLIPILLFTVLVVLTVGWLFIGWSFITLLPYFIGLTVVFVCSAGYAFSQKGILRAIAGILFGISAALSLVYLTDIADIRSTWELLTMTGLIGIQLYLYSVTHSSQLIKGKMAFLTAIPLLTSIGTIVAANFAGTSFSLAWWSLFLALLLAIVGLLFGYRKKQIT